MTGIVYCITNTENGKIYIGSSANYKSRKYAHKTQLNRDIHHNKYLQRSWNKYGEECFEFSILEKHIDIPVLIERERYWIQYYDSTNKDIGYNMAIPLVTGGYEHLDETKQHLREKAYQMYNRLVHRVIIPVFYIILIMIHK